MKELHDLTDLQLVILREVWRRKRATVTDVHEALVGETGLAKKTIGTMMTRLEKQGFLEHSAEGREFVYEPTVSEEEVGRAKVRNIVDRLFGGSVTALVSHALEAKDVKPGDVERVRSLIAEFEQKDRTKAPSSTSKKPSATRPAPSVATPTTWSGAAPSARPRSTPGSRTFSSSRRSCPGKSGGRWGGSREAPVPARPED